MNVRKARTAFVKFLVLIVLFSWFPGLNAQEQETELSAIELIQLSRRYVAQNELATALTYARKAIEVDPAFPGAWKQVGRILMLDAQYEDALGAFQTIIELKATDPQVESWILYTLERIIGQRDSYDLSEFLASWMGDGLRDDARLVVTSLREIFAGRLSSAEDLLNSLRAISGETVNLIAYAWFQLGDIHRSERSYESAISAFNNALLYRNNWLPAFREMGWSYSAMDRPKDAADTWARGLAIMPDVNSTYRSWLNWVVEARIQAEQYPEALVSIDQLLKISPNDSDALYYKFLILEM